MTTVEDNGANAEAVKVTVAEQVGTQGLLVKVEALTPVGSVVRILNVTGEVVVDPFNVAVAVSTPPAAPGVMTNVEGLAANVKHPENPQATRVTVAVWVTAGVPPLA